MGKYGTKVNQRLGAGAFGEVYKMDSPPDVAFYAEHPIVAVKMIRVSCQREKYVEQQPIEYRSGIIFSAKPQQFQDPEPNAFEEINILRELRHSHIVSYLTSFTDTAVRGRLCIVMDFCGNGNLTNAARVNCLCDIDMLLISFQYESSGHE